MRNNKFCNICNKPYLLKDSALHWHCTDCGLLIPALNERDKHVKVVHGRIPCTCGVHLSMDLMRVHRRHDCPDRILTCRYCGNREVAGALQVRGF